MTDGSGAAQCMRGALADARITVPDVGYLNAHGTAACDLDHIREKPRSAAIDYALSNSFGFGRHNVCLVFGRPSTGRQRLI